MKLSGWGKYPLIDAKVETPQTLDELAAMAMQGQAIARGNGRGYGDCAIGADTTIDMRRFNRMLAFDASTGQLVAEAGVMLADVIDVFVPRGFFPYVVPGTKFVTLGGMAASDVHGKNHHQDGSFANYVDWLDVISADGKIIRCSRKKNPELFNNSLGGMGLTGVILRLALRLRPIKTAWINSRTLIADNINHAIKLFDQHHDAHYSVAWIDCLSRGEAMGRSVIYLGEHSSPSEISNLEQGLLMPKKNKIHVPVNFPSWTLNRLTVGLFNHLYFNKAKRASGKQVDLDSFFFPLDNVLGWNKIYGERGFVQLQCVLPISQSTAGLTELLGRIASAGVSPFLAVLKKLGTSGGGISFPMEGYTLCLDFPVSEKTLDLKNQLEQITLNYGGRFYLAKDANLSKDVFNRSDSRIAGFKKFRTAQKMDKRFVSAQSLRLGL